MVLRLHKKLSSRIRLFSGFVLWVFAFVNIDRSPVVTAYNVCMHFLCTTSATQKKKERREE